jgi:hypothetical protein
VLTRGSAPNPETAGAEAVAAVLTVAGQPNPVSPRDTLRVAVREGAHGIVFVHDHPSGDASPSPDDADLTERLRAASELVGIMARDHVIVASGGYYSFVEAGRWRRQGAAPPSAQRSRYSPASSSSFATAPGDRMPMGLQGA